MTLLPQTSPLPLPVFMPQMSPAPDSTPSPIPNRKAAMKKTTADDADSNASTSDSKTFPFPKLRLEVRDLMHPGSGVFLSSVVASTALKFSVEHVLSLLYVSPNNQYTTVPETRSVTLILRSMDGVAYTTGSELDGAHKEIHFSVDYINSVNESRKSDEILGVLVHEMVHCYQYNAYGTCPGGLIEGIADWVRLNTNLAPPHWDPKKKPDKWDAGYQNTGYFLQYLETRYGSGTISKMNEKLRTAHYEEKRFWTELLGRPVEQLWSDYVETIESEGKSTTDISNSTIEDEELVMVEKEDAKNPQKMSVDAEPKAKVTLNTRVEEEAKNESAKYDSSAPTRVI